MTGETAMYRRLIFTCVIAVGIALHVLSLGAWAKGEYLSQTAFLDQAFAGIQPAARVCWLNDRDKETALDIFSHRYAGLRVRYWQAKEKTAWIVDEIGKTRPITIGVVVTPARKIERVRILAFRESRGWEVRYPAFTRQFVGVSAVSPGTELDTSIDGVTGATLSVKAVKRVARFALYLHERCTSDI